MTITITLSADAERNLADLAARTGRPVDELASGLVERELGTRTIGEILAPVHGQSREAGYTEEDLDAFFEGLIDEVFRDRGKCSDGAAR